MKLILMGAALMLAGAGAIGTSFADDAKLQVTSPAWKGYQDYLATATDARHGFFAMSKDGQIWGSSGCPKGQCPDDATLQASAIKRCEQFSANTPCVIFAADRNILVPYTVKDYTQFGQ